MKAGYSKDRDHTMAQRLEVWMKITRRSPVALQAYGYTDHIGAPL